MDVTDMARRVVAAEIDELRLLLDRLADNEAPSSCAFREATNLLCAALDAGRKIIVLGVGKSGHIGDKIAATLTSTGSRAVVLNSLNALHGDLGIVEDGDVVLALSYSGETEELLAVLPALSRFDVSVISMTAKPNSTLARFSKVVLDVAVKSEACPLGLAPTSSTTVMLVLGDALAMALVELRGFNREDFARFHPAGRLGRRLLLKASDVMRSGDRLALCTTDVSVREALKRMTRCRSGAVVVTDERAKLAGIFTQGDFARRYQEHSAVGDLTIGDVMTRNPAALRADQPAVDVLAIIEQRQIDDVVVINADDQPVGLIDSQDLSRFHLL
jgi:arabinose-5-phosphate isomerase